MPRWERSPTLAPATASRPSARSISSTRAARCTGARGWPSVGDRSGCSSAATASVSRTVSMPKKPSSCLSSATDPSPTMGAPSLDAPSSHTRVLDGTAPAMACSKVVLPEPEGPKTPSNRPCRAVTVISWRSGWPSSVTETRHWKPFPRASSASAPLPREMRMAHA
eukprot:scaffold2646_cov103-Isochrysis_galbana.AAC.2